MAKKTNKKKTASSSSKKNNGAASSSKKKSRLDPNSVILKPVCSCGWEGEKATVKGAICPNKIETGEGVLVKCGAPVKGETITRAQFDKIRAQEATDAALASEG